VVIYFIGVPFIYENLPRFEDTWGHSFLGQEMFREKKVNIGLSIYEEYPGSFLYFGLIFEFLPKYLVMQFFPLLVCVVGLFLVYLITKNLINNRIALITPIFYTFFNWTIEDNHISPQFLNIFLYFFLILILIKLLNEKRFKIVYALTIALFTIAITFSHPLTPLFLISILFFMVILTKGLRKRLLPIFIIVLAIYILYEIYMTTTFTYIIDYIRNFFQIVVSRPTVESSRFAGLSFEFRQVIFGSKMFLVAFSFIFSLFGILILRKKKYGTEARFFIAWILSMIPFILVMSQIFKGEFYERFVLISSLPLAFLTTYFLYQRKVNVKIIFIILLILTVPYFFAKHGNEAFQSESIEKLNADCYLNRFSTDCQEKMEIVGSPLNWDIQNLGLTHFGISREEIMASSIYNDKSLTDIFNIIENQTESLRLDRIYSTYESATYIKS
jgi:hypothetical protein